jgi:hypothetical protein
MNESMLLRVVRAVAPELKYSHLSEKIPLLKNRSVAFFINEPWNLSLLREVRKAKNFKKTIENEKLKRIFVFSYSRSGTHNFVSRFHYLPCNFCFREHAFESEEDPFQLKVNSQKLKSSHYLALSMFGEYGLQNKFGKELSHLFFWNNRYLEYPQQLPLTNYNPVDDRMIFYVRNIFRTLYSRHKSSARIGKPKPRFKIDDDRFEFALRQHRRKLKEMLNIKAIYPDSVAFCFHEVFCAQPKEIIEDVCSFLGIPLEMTVHWEPPQNFFQKCFGSDNQPVLKDGKLWCSKKQNYILGTGGKFNPLSYPNLERTMKDPIEKFITPVRYDLALQLFGKELVDFWLNDKDFPYNRESSDHVMDLIARSLGS